MGAVITFPIAKTKRRPYSLTRAEVIQLPGTRRSSSGLPTQAQVTKALLAFRKAAEEYASRNSKPAQKRFTKTALKVFENKLRGKT
ncbi:MAG: hypothetical protein ACPHIA_07815 [Alphaproteobacteria bacterium]